jgi:hypothetical protein
MAEDPANRWDSAGVRDGGQGREGKLSLGAVGHQFPLPLLNEGLPMPVGLRLGSVLGTFCRDLLRVEPSAVLKLAAQPVPGTGALRVKAGHGGQVGRRPAPKEI